MSHYSPLKVVIVDDNELAAELLAEFLQMLHHEVRTAADGAQALALCAQEPPDVVIVDIILPDIDGDALAAKLQAQLQPAPVIIALSGLPKDMQRNDATLFAAWLEKPVDLAVLEAKLAEAARKDLPDAA